VSIGIGETLRGAREEQGRTIEDAARDTRVRGHYLLALEDEQFDAFGGDVYAKGFLSSYARYLQLDPQPLLDDYRRHFQDDGYNPSALTSTPMGRPPASPPPTWIAWAVVVVVVMVGVAALAQVFGGRTPEAAQPRAPQPAVSASPDDAASAPPRSSPTPSPAPTYDGVNLLLALEDDSWMRVSIDGQLVLEETLPRGETRTFTGEESITIRFGDPGAVRAELNGEDLGAQGARGQPVTVTFTRDGARSA
jgi:cytoskeleton protein RodZ